MHIFSRLTAFMRRWASTSILRLSTTHMRRRPKASGPCGVNDFTPRQRAARREWQNLCFTLEALQRAELCQSECDKYQFARTYQTYDQRLDKVMSGVRRAARKGKFDFFTRRGIPNEVMDALFAERLLCDWRTAIVSKKTVAERRFWCRFAEDIEVFVNLPRNHLRIAIAESLHSSNAVFLLGDHAGRYEAERTGLASASATDSSVRDGVESAMTDSAL